MLFFQGTHSDWKNWKNWEGIFQSEKSQGILNRLEKSGTITRNTVKFREFQTNILFVIFYWYLNVLCIIVKWIKFSVKKQNFKNKLEKWKKYWKSEAILSVRKNGNHVLTTKPFTLKVYLHVTVLGSVRFCHHYEMCSFLLLSE